MVIQFCDAWTYLLEELGQPRSASQQSSPINLKEIS
jgi:hypothetical protein